MSVLSTRLLAVHDAFTTANLSHAFGGAIALAYCTNEPRGTRDIDVNVFIDASRGDEAFDALPRSVTVLSKDRVAAKRDGQVRVFWNDTPVDLFFNTQPFHDQVAAGVVQVPFFNRSIPILGCNALAVFKAMFNRTRDWADLEAMRDAQSLDLEELIRQIRTFIEPEDPRIERLRGLL